MTLTPQALARLRAYIWPGNVRELRNVIERAAILSESAEIGAEHLPRDVAASTAPSAAAANAPRMSAIDASERDLILDALVRAGNNESKAARLLGLSRAQLRSRIEKHGIVPDD